MHPTVPSLTPEDAHDLGRSAVRAVRDATTLEAAACALCSALHEATMRSAADRPCVMVRCYITHAYGSLPPDVQRFAKRAYGAVAITPPEPEMRCLVLVGTAGDEPEWNDRRASRGHQAIPLPSPHVVERAPMVAQLVRELGLDLSRVVRPAPDLLRGLGGDTYGVFHVEQAAGSQYIPAQRDFVERYGISSVLGFGGALPSGELFAVILFARAHIGAAIAEQFRPVAAEVLGAVTQAALHVFDVPTA